MPALPCICHPCSTLMIKRPLPFPHSPHIGPSCLLHLVTTLVIAWILRVTIVFLVLIIVLVHVLYIYFLSTLGHRVFAVFVQTVRVVHACADLALGPTHITSRVTYLSQTSPLAYNPSKDQCCSVTQDLAKTYLHAVLCVRQARHTV